MAIAPVLRMLFTLGLAGTREAIKEQGGAGKLAKMPEDKFRDFVKGKKKGVHGHKKPGKRGPDGVTRPGSPPAKDDVAGQALQKLRSSENYKEFKPESRKEALETLAKTYKTKDKAQMLGALDNALGSAFADSSMSVKEKNKRILSELGGDPNDPSSAVLVPQGKGGNLNLFLKTNKEQAFGTIQIQDDGSFKFTKNDAWQKLSNVT